MQGKRVSFLPEPPPPGPGASSPSVTPLKDPTLTNEKPTLTNMKPTLTNEKPALTNVDDKPTEDSGVESGQWGHDDEAVRHAHQQNDHKDESKAGVYIFHENNYIYSLSLSEK